MNISISKDIENNCPQFKQLLEKLAERLDTSGRTKETQRDYEVVKEKMERARKKYLETSVRVEILKELITSEFLTLIIIFTLLPSFRLRIEVPDKSRVQT